MHKLLSAHATTPPNTYFLVIAPNTIWLPGFFLSLETFSQRIVPNPSFLGGEMAFFPMCRSIFPHLVLLSLLKRVCFENID